MASFWSGAAGGFGPPKRYKQKKLATQAARFSQFYLITAQEVAIRAKEPASFVVDSNSSTDRIGKRSRDAVHHFPVADAMHKHAALTITAGSIEYMPFVMNHLIWASATFIVVSDHSPRVRI